MSFSLPFLKRVSTGQDVVAIRTKPDSNPGEIAKVLQLPEPSSLLLLSGGAGLMSEESHRRLATLFEAVGEVLVQANATVIDGGTQSGVADLMGRALARSNRSSPYIGVLSASAKISPDEPTVGEEILEPNHSHFVLVESDEWGDEVALMYGLAGYLAQQIPSITLLVNGGGVSLQEVEWNVKQGREIVVIAGSGRLADDIAQAVHDLELSTKARIHLDTKKERIQEVVQKGHLTLFDLSSPIGELVELLQQRLMPKTPAPKS